MYVSCNVAVSAANFPSHLFPFITAQTALGQLDESNTDDKIRAVQLVLASSTGWAQPNGSFFGFVELKSARLLAASLVAFYTFMVLISFTAPVVGRGCTVK